MNAGETFGGILPTSAAAGDKVGDELASAAVGGCLKVGSASGVSSGVTPGGKLRRSVGVGVGFAVDDVGAIDGEMVLAVIQHQQRPVHAGHTRGRMSTVRTGDPSQNQADI